MDHNAATLDRRTLLRGAAGATAAAVGGGVATGTAAAQEAEEILVGPGGENVFEPASLEIAPGTTVNFVWESDNHNVVVDSQPDGAGWEGHEPIENTGFEFSHTFETEGEYAYFCQPHVNAGMEGTITVTQNPGGDGDGGAVGPPEVPASAMSLTTGIIGAFLSICAITFYFIKYGGTDEE